MVTRPLGRKTGKCTPPKGAEDLVGQKRFSSPCPERFRNRWQASSPLLSDELGWGHHNKTPRQVMGGVGERISGHHVPIPGSERSSSRHHTSGNLFSAAEPPLAVERAKMPSTGRQEGWHQRAGPLKASLVAARDRDAPWRSSEKDRSHFRAGGNFALQKIKKYHKKNKTEGDLPQALGFLRILPFFVKHF